MTKVMKKTSKKGFTLAELLIVVAIIGVLVGISIPIFTSQLKKSNLATNQANARAAYAATTAAILDEGFVGGTATYSVDTATLTADPTEVTTTNTTATAAIKTWDIDDDMGGGELGTTVYTSWTVTVDAAGHVAISGS